MDSSSFTNWSLIHFTSIISSSFGSQSISHVLFFSTALISSSMASLYFIFLHANLMCYDKITWFFLILYCTNLIWVLCVYLSNLFFFDSVKIRIQWSQIFGFLLIHASWGVYSLWAWSWALIEYRVDTYYHLDPKLFWFSVSLNHNFYAVENTLVFLLPLYFIEEIIMPHTHIKWHICHKILNAFEMNSSPLLQWMVLMK